MNFYQLRNIDNCSLTETTPAACVQAGDHIVPGSSGLLCPSMYARVVNEDGKVGERGELWLKGPNIMKGYLNRPQETADCIDTEGFFHTGDVAPAELEGVLLKHKDVLDCAVIGVYDPKQATEIPRAYVVLKSNVDHMAYRFGADLKNFCGFQRGDVLAIYAPNAVDAKKEITELYISLDMFF
ncbi:hypothetical protein BDA99DRAFT_606524 [Phascolomyces articulosus]|uniref:AMP-dependent synthetase/ligase domain-containing protein n=1 Tax=Phascolomyces articulosus TaxID=60185 RepID=A0AAD5JWC8_9FUNG|nr:hypothetical protein BDA99DRAFT_606524 [Phascolomyces articulosus]